MFNKINNLAKYLGVAVAAALPLQLWAQASAPGAGANAAANWPNKTVRIIVPYTAGGGTDAVARGLANQLSEAWGQPVVVENRPGGSTMIGADHVAKSAPDGYTMLFSDSAAFVINQHLYSKMPYKPLTDLAPITVVVRLAPVLALSNAVPVNNLRELIAYAKTNPGKLSYASFGSGSYPHVITEQFKRMAGIDILHVPYKGSAAAVTDMLSGQLSMLIVTLSVFEQHEKAGKLKVLATTTDRRLSLRPDLPTISEAGVPGYAASVWFGLAATAGTPEPVLTKIHAEVVKTLADPVYRAKFITAQSLEPGGMSRAEFSALLRSEEVRWGQLVRESGAKIE
jgi:tripartite-type tricarboxylate transporter receptor subunit TctC